MTARLLATCSSPRRAPELDHDPALPAVLYEAHLRTYRVVLPSALNAVEFPLLIRLFPRSILFPVSRAEQCMRDIEPRAERVALSDQAPRLLGQIRSELEYRPIAEILEQLPLHMDNVQLATSAASEAIRQRYFPTNAAPSRVGRPDELVSASGTSPASTTAAT